MNIKTDHDYEIIVFHFEYLITKAEQMGYPYELIEKRLSYSESLTDFENSDINSFLFSNTSDLFNNIFYESKNNEIKDIEFNWINNWISQAYFYLQIKFNINFELLFAYLPITDMKQMFALYHEMDNSVLGDYLKDKMTKVNPLKLFLKKRKITLAKLSRLTNISVNTLSSYSNGARSIKLMSLENALKVAHYLKIKTKSLIN